MLSHQLTGLRAHCWMRTSISLYFPSPLLQLTPYSWFTQSLLSHLLTKKASLSVSWGIRQGESGGLGVGGVRNTTTTKNLQTEFNKEVQQPASIRHRAWPDKCSEQEPAGLTWGSCNKREVRVSVRKQIQRNCTQTAPHPRLGNGTETSSVAFRTSPSQPVLWMLSHSHR